MIANNNNLSPILKWAGGKEKELNFIIPNSPANFENYYEPFVGGGAVYASFNAKKYFINDKSSELISLYHNIALNNTAFYSWLDNITTTWKSVLTYSNSCSFLIQAYKDFRSSIIDAKEIKSRILKYIENNWNDLNLILYNSFQWKLDIFKAELIKNLTRKTLRMYKLEQERGQMSDTDISDNIETAFMSSLYMYFRTMYNNKEIINSNSSLATALFVFIRNYAYSGMFRYNSDGDFNVPYGGMSYNHKLLNNKISYYQSQPLKEHLDKTIIENLDFQLFLDKYKPTENDFVFLDPPYDSDFSTYAKNAFTLEDQKRLSDYLCNDCKAKWMMIIKNTPFIFSLYNKPELTIKTFDKKYLVSFMNRNDKNTEHLIITNY